MGAMQGSMAEQVGVLQVNSGTASSTPLAGTAVKMDRHQKALVIFLLGDMAAETIDCVVQRCDAAGANPATLKAATQLVAHGSNNDSKQVVVAVDASDLIASGQQYIRGLITTGGATGGLADIVVLGGEAKYGPAGNFDNASVLQVVP
jgi:hypothetical protein